MLSLRAVVELEDDCDFLLSILGLGVLEWSSSLSVSHVGFGGGGPMAGEVVRTTTYGESERNDRVNR